MEPIARPLPRLAPLPGEPRSTCVPVRSTDHAPTASCRHPALPATSVAAQGLPLRLRRAPPASDLLVTRLSRGAPPWRPPRRGRAEAALPALCRRGAGTRHAPRRACCRAERPLRPSGRCGMPPDRCGRLLGGERCGLLPRYRTRLLEYETQGVGAGAAASTPSRPERRNPGSGLARTTVQSAPIACSSRLPRTRNTTRLTDASTGRSRSTGRGTVSMIRGSTTR